MKTIIAGSRKFKDYVVLRSFMDTVKPRPTLVLSGCADGADDLGERWARAKKIPIKRFRPDWNKYGKKAGPMRNLEMALQAQTLVAFWNGESRGTRHMIATAAARGLRVVIKRVRA